MDALATLNLRDDEQERALCRGVMNVLSPDATESAFAQLLDRPHTEQSFRDSSPPR